MYYICTRNTEQVWRRSLRDYNTKRENSSVGRARPCQGRGRGFEPRFSLNENLNFARVVELVDTLDLKSSG